MRLIVGIIILCFLVAAILASVNARPLGATAIVCNPVMVPDAVERKKRITKV